MKAIMISIKPKYVAKILNGTKTLEIRKTMPKCDLPIDVYIYCTKNGELLLHELKTNSYFAEPESEHYRPNYGFNGKVIAKFTLNKVECIFYNDYYELFMSTFLSDEELCEKSCVSQKDMVDYFATNGGNCGYAWHISNLVIFDEPKELSEFRTYAEKPNCQQCKSWQKYHEVDYCKRYPCNSVKLTKAPQSWCYVEIL